MGRILKVAAAQFACSWQLDENLNKAEQMIRKAAAAGARLILIQELFATPYFCIDQDPSHRRLAKSVHDSQAVALFLKLSKELDCVLPCSFFERSGQAFYNSIAICDQGRLLGIYRKTHIPNGPAYQEKHFFNPGDTGFKVWDTSCGRIGVGICWDQWFPESARAMALMGAEILLFPTAIGSEPDFPEQNSRMHWQRVQQGHAAANLMPLIAANRIGTEKSLYLKDYAMTFYGSSFIADEHGAVVAQADDQTEQIITAQFDLDKLDEIRSQWGIFRDRRPEMYGALLSSDGREVTAAGCGLHQ